MPLLRGALLLASVWLLVACAAYEPRPLPVPPHPQIAQSAETEGVRVATAILTDEQARQHYGVDLASESLQAIWLRVENRSPLELWFLIAALDPDYYAPYEAAFLFRNATASEHHERLIQYFRQEAMPLLIRSEVTAEGYVLAPRAEGGRYVNVELVGHEKRLRFGFAMPIAGGDFDFEGLRSAKLYAEAERRDLDDDELRAVLRELPCCTTDPSGEGRGDPLNVAIVGEQQELLTALARSGWSFTHRIDLRSLRRLVGAALAGTPYPVAPVSPLYMFGRSQDIALQRARSSVSQRNHMRLWLAPFRYEDRSVWVGQISRDVGVKVTSKSPVFTTHVIDPQIDEAREYLLQSLLIHHAVERFGFVEGVGAATEEEPRGNLVDDPYYTDGLRLVVVLARDLVPPQRARNFHWREVEDPISAAQAESPTPAPSRTGAAAAQPMGNGR